MQRSIVSPDIIKNKVSLINAKSEALHLPSVEEVASEFIIHGGNIRKVAEKFGVRRIIINEMLKNSPLVAEAKELAMQDSVDTIHEMYVDAITRGYVEVVEENDDGEMVPVKKTIQTGTLLFHMMKYLDLQKKRIGAATDKNVFIQNNHFVQDNVVSPEKMDAIFELLEDDKPKQ